MNEVQEFILKRAMQKVAADAEINWDDVVGRPLPLVFNKPVETALDIYTESPDEMFDRAHRNGKRAGQAARRNIQYGGAYVDSFIPALIGHRNAEAVARVAKDRVNDAYNNIDINGKGALPALKRFFRDVNNEKARMNKKP
jgi:hypothetical protein